MFVASQFENITLRRANDVQQSITVLGVVMSLFVSRFETRETLRNEI